MNIKQKEASGLLESKNLKKTDFRINMLNFLLKNKKPISAKEISFKIDADKVTTYRTLETLLKKGLVKRVDTGEREGRYELVDFNDDHHHIICIECKKIVDFIGCDSKKVISNALTQVKDFKMITHHSFDLFGICNTCFEDDCSSKIFCSE